MLSLTSLGILLDLNPAAVVSRVISAFYPIFLYEAGATQKLFAGLNPVKPSQRKLVNGQSVR